MQKFISAVATVALMSAGSLAAAPAADTASASPAHAIYDTAMSHVDTGGEMLVFLNADGAVKQLLKIGLDLAGVLAEEEADAVGAQSFVDRLDAYLGKIGLYGLESFAMSSRRRSDGMYAIKSYMGHKPGGALWRLYGERPRKLSLLGYAPADADVVLDLTLDPAVAWQLVREGVRDVGGAEADQRFTVALEKMKTEDKIDITDLLKSAGKEVLISLTMPPAADAPPPGAAVAMPQFIVALVVRNDKILKAALENTKATRGDDAPKVQGDLRVYTLNPSAPGLVLASRPGVLMLASSAALVESAVAGFRSGTNITVNPDVVKYQPAGGEKCNGFSYTSAGCAQGLEALTGGVGEGPEAGVDERLIELLGTGPKVGLTWCTADGIRSHTVSKSDGRSLLLMAPLGVLAGFAVPSFTHAHARAQGADCAANLRQIEMAVEMYKLDHEDAPPTLPDLENYLNRKSLECPEGGTYQLGEENDGPRCTIHGGLSE